jgi:hypothetical protein
VATASATAVSAIIASTGSGSAFVSSY